MSASDMENVIISYVNTTQAKRGNKRGCTLSKASTMQCVLSWIFEWQFRVVDIPIKIKHICIVGSALSSLLLNFFKDISPSIYLKENETNWWFGVLQNLELIKKTENMTFLMKILQGLMLKHVYILLILNFPLNMQAAIFSLSVT
jgi:hypothetical protein